MEFVWVVRTILKTLTRDDGAVTSGNASWNHLLERRIGLAP